MCWQTFVFYYLRAISTSSPGPIEDIQPQYPTEIRPLVLQGRRLHSLYRSPTFRHNILRPSLSDLNVFSSLKITTLFSQSKSMYDLANCSRFCRCAVESKIFALACCNVNQQNAGDSSRFVSSHCVLLLLRG